MEDRRRQSVVFENVAKDMLRYLENSEELKVGITEFQVHLEVLVQIGITLQQVAQQPRTKRNQKVFDFRFFCLFYLYLLLLLFFTF